MTISTVMTEWPGHASRILPSKMPPAADPAGNASAAKSGTDTAIGPNSPGEIERKLARLEELEHETRRQKEQLARYSGPEGKLGPETLIRLTRSGSSFLQALRALAKAEAPAVPDKGKCWTKQSAPLEKDKALRSSRAR